MTEKPNAIPLMIRLLDMVSFFITDSPIFFCISIHEQLLNLYYNIEKTGVQGNCRDLEKYLFLASNLRKDMLQ